MFSLLIRRLSFDLHAREGGGYTLCTDCSGMCRCSGYGFQTIQFRTGCKFCQKQGTKLCNVYKQISTGCNNSSRMRIGLTGYVDFFLIHRPDLFRTGYQNQAISSLEQSMVCEGPMAHPHPKFWWVPPPPGPPCNYKFYWYTSQFRGAFFSNWEEKGDQGGTRTKSLVIKSKVVGECTKVIHLLLKAGGVIWATEI